MNLELETIEYQNVQKIVGIVRIPYFRTGRYSNRLKEPGEIPGLMRNRETLGEVGNLFSVDSWSMCLRNLR